MLLILAALAQAVATLATLDLRWNVPLASPAGAPPAYDADAAYVPLRGGVLVAVDVSRGTVRWQREVTTDLSPSTGEQLVFVAAAGLVEALAAPTGQTRWRTPVPGRIVTITWDHGWLLCSTDAGEMVAMRASDGEPLWKAALGASLVAPPAAGLDRIYAATEGGRVVSLDLATGRQLWVRNLQGNATAMQAVDGQLIVGTTSHAVVSLDLVSGRQRWRWRVGGDVAGAAASDARHVYFAARDNVLRAVDIRSGNLRWTAELPSRPLAGPQLLRGAVLIPLATTVAAFDPATGKPVGSIAASGEISAAPHIRPEGRPTAARLVALTRDGRLQGFGLRIEDPPATVDALPGQRVLP